MIDKQKLFKFYIILIIIFGVIFNLVIPDFLNYKSAFVYYFSIALIYLAFLVILYLMSGHFQKEKRKIMILLLVFIIATIVPSGCIYFTEFNTVPDLKYKTLDEAKSILDENGFIANVSSIPTNSLEVNKVLRQEPSSDLLLKKNSIVNIFVGELEQKIIINQPKDDDFVHHNITVSGTVKNLSDNEKVYLLVQPKSVNGDGPYEWYIQPSPSNPGPVNVTNGTWQCVAYIGKNDSATVDKRREFRIVAIVTTETLTNSSVAFNLPIYNSIYSIFVTRV